MLSSPLYYLLFLDIGEEMVKGKIAYISKEKLKLEGFERVDVEKHVWGKECFFSVMKIF